MQNDIVSPPTKPKTEDAAPHADTSLESSKKSETPSTQTPAKTATIDSVAAPTPNEHIQPNTVTEKPAKKKSNLPIGVIAIAILICVGLIGLSVYLAVNESKNTSKIDKLQAPAAVTNKPATTAQPDVQGAIEQTDKLPDGTDDTSTELTDQSLGL